MSANSDQVVVGAAGRVYVAPVGTTLPTSPTATLDSAFADLGYVSEEGVTLAFAVTTEDVIAWQTSFPIRRIGTGFEGSASFTLLQFNADTVAVAFGGGAVTEPTPGVYKYTPPAASDVAEYAAVIEWADGLKDYRWVINRCTVSDGVETNIVRNAAASLPISLSVLGDDGQDPWYLLTNDPALAPAGS
jgi:hypothetical protein